MKASDFHEVRKLRSCCFSACQQENLWLLDSQESPANQHQHLSSPEPHLAFPCSSLVEQETDILKRKKSEEARKSNFVLWGKKKRKNKTEPKNFLTAHEVKTDGLGV
jgi:hypothetical protein